MQGLVRLAAVAVAVSCARERPAPPHDAPAPRAPIVAVLRASVAAARAQIEPAGGCITRPAYLELRRSLLATIPIVRHAVPMGAEIIIGPPVVIGETAGSLSELDMASDCKLQREALYQIDQALQLIDSELASRPPSPRAIYRGLSDAAYALGAEALESAAGTPSEEDAVAADLEGLGRGIAAAMRALGTEVRVPTGDRLAVAIATGLLGDEIRASAARAGITLKPPYRALVAGPVSALTLPVSLIPTSPEKAKLGEALFRWPKLSLGGARACTGCHEPARAFSDGRVTPRSLDPATPLRRNTPSLLYAPLAAVLHWDGRIRTADAQALNVIHARAEMGLTSEEALRIIRGEASLSALFRAAFSDGVTEANLGHALAAYEAAILVPGRAPIDRLARGDASAWTADMAKGMDVFVKRGRCARCHVPPTFGGARPPDFTAPVYAVLGVPTKPGSKVLDPDLGRGAYTHSSLDAHAFRTPTIRNVGSTAPYFHHGAFPRLEDVVEHYDKGGGKGLGFAVPNQDPDVRPLSLTAEERRTLLVFLREGVAEGP